jgi:hypothetical protein
MITCSMFERSATTPWTADLSTRSINNYKRKRPDATSLCSFSYPIIYYRRISQYCSNKAFSSYSCNIFQIHHLAQMPAIPIVEQLMEFYSESICASIVLLFYDAYLSLGCCTFYVDRSFHSCPCWEETRKTAIFLPYFRCTYSARVFSATQISSDDLAKKSQIRFPNAERLGTSPSSKSTKPPCVPQHHTARRTYSR